MKAIRKSKRISLFFGALLSTSYFLYYFFIIQHFFKENIVKKIASMATNFLSILFFIALAPSLISLIKGQYSLLLTPSTKIGQVILEGTIEKAEPLTHTLRAFFKDPSIKAILIRCESPGGYPGSSQALFNEIQHLKKEYPKPIITLTENICTSGAYYVACATDHIICSPAALVGSIGTRFTTFFNAKKWLESHHITSETISAGSYKTALSPFTDLTQSQKNMLNALAQDTYEQFAYDVSVSRKLPFNEKDTWANGRIFTGQQALVLKLIDTTGSYCDALKLLHKLAPINGEIVWISSGEKSAVTQFLEQIKKIFSLEAYTTLPLSY